MTNAKRAVPALLLAGAAGISLAAMKAESQGSEVELEAAKVFIEWNSTAKDFGIHFSWDGEAWAAMAVRDGSGRTVLNVQARRNLKTQGLTEGFFESAEPPDVSMEQFFDRFPEGEYEFEGATLAGNPLVGEAEFSHVLPKPPANLSPKAGDVVDPDGFTVSFGPVTKDVEGNPIDIAYYEVEVTKEEEDPILQNLRIILRPSVTSVEIPAAFLEPDTGYKFEVIAVMEGGNSTLTESGTFRTGDH